MTHIICRVSACVFWEQGVCGSEEIEYEIDEGCLTFQDMVDMQLEEEEAEDEDELEWAGGSAATLFVSTKEDDEWEEDEDDWEDGLDL